jgi:hypothetical protein
MILPLFRRLTDEDLADAPKGNWKSKLMYAYNLFIQQVISGLSNNLTPEQNCVEQTKSFLIVGDSTPSNNVYNFTTLFTYNPNFIEQWVLVADGSNPIFSSAPYVSAAYNNGKVEVLGISGLTMGVTYQVTIRVWWPPVTNG